MSVCQGCGVNLPPKTAPGRQRKWCNDNCRRRTMYAGTCQDCGAPTAWSGTSVPSPRCRDCATKRRLIWTQDAIIAAIQKWAREHGAAPTATDWNPNQATKVGRSDKAAKFYAEGCWPSLQTVQLKFGSWNKALEAAGFEPRDTNQRARRDPDAIPRTVRLYAEGLSMGEIAERESITTTGVRFRLLGAGVKPRPRGMTEAQRMKLAALYAAGHTARELAQRFDVSRGTVYRIASAAGMCRRDRRRVAA